MASGRRPYEPPPTEAEAAALPLDPTELPDGTERVLLFRAAEENSYRSASGLVGIFYRGELVQSLRALQEHTLASHGAGRYRVVVQRMIAECWTYLTSTVFGIGDVIPPEPDAP